MDFTPNYVIEIVYECDSNASPDTGLLHSAVRAALRQHQVREASLNFVITDDPTIAKMNETYLQHEGPTDVLTFDLRDTADSLLEGEIVISADTARRESTARGHSPEAELALYAVHGVLHLLGYDDKSPESAARMHEMEDQIFRQMGLHPVYDSPSV